MNGIIEILQASPSTNFDMKKAILNMLRRSFSSDDRVSMFLIFPSQGYKDVLLTVHIPLGERPFPREWRICMLCIATRRFGTEGNIRWDDKRPH